MPKPTFFNLPADKRERILNLAIAEFSENDYKNASISRIVAEAGIAKGSFYQYFVDKKDLYLYLIELATQEKTQFFESNQPTELMEVFAFLRWIITLGMRFEFSNPQLAQIGYRAVYGDAPLPAETKTVIESGMTDYFRQLLAQGQERNELKPDIDLDVAVFMFNAVFSNLGDFLLKRQSVAPDALLGEQGALAGSETEVVLDQVFEILREGMGA
jgi:AcrR family transcriptional regulator